jgi:hypothetical protein
MSHRKTTRRSCHGAMRKGTQTQAGARDRPPRSASPFRLGQSHFHPPLRASVASARHPHAVLLKTNPPGSPDRTCENHNLMASPGASDGRAPTQEDLPRPERVRRSLDRLGSPHFELALTRFGPAQEACLHPNPVSGGRTRQPRSRDCARVRGEAAWASN